MAPRRRTTALLALCGLALAAWVAWEILRPRPPLAPPVESQPSTDARETARLEDGFSWIASREGRQLFALLGRSLVGLQGGANVVEGIRQLNIPLESGGVVEVQAERARIRQVGAGDADVEVALEGQIRVKDPGGSVLETDRLVFDAIQKRLLSPGPALVTGPGLRARLSDFEYRPDARTLVAKGPLAAELGGATVWRIDASHVEYELEHGTLLFSTVVRARRPEGALIAARARVDLPKSGAVSRTLVDGPALLSGASGSFSWRMATARMSGDGLVAGATPSSQSVEFGPPASVLLRRTTGAEGVGWIETERWRVSSPGRDVATLIAGGPGFTGRWTDSRRKQEWTLKGDWLEFRRRPDGELENADARGHVSAAGPDGAALDGEHLRWDSGRPAEIVVTGDRARARQGGDVIEASRIVLLRDEHKLVAEGSPLTEASSLQKGEGALFRGDEPVRVRSSRVVIVENGPLEFEGPVQAWQQDTTLRAARMTVLRAEGRLVAEGDVQLMTPVTDRSGARRRVKAAGRRLDYSAAGREARLSGGASFEDPSGTVEAREMVVRMQPDGKLDSLDAVDAVTMVLQGHRGRADRLEWRGGGEGQVTLIGERDLAQLESERGVLRAARIRYDLARGEGYSESGGGRGTIEGRPTDAAPKPDARGEQP